MSFHPAVVKIIHPEINSRVALLRDESKMLVLGRHSAGRPKIAIYSSSGIHLASLTVRPAPPLPLHQIADLLRSGISPHPS